MRHFKTMLACMATTLLFSCSKKDEDKKVSPDPEMTTYWLFNGRKMTPTKIETDSKSFTGSIYSKDTLKVMVGVSFSSNAYEGTYRIGGLSDRKDVNLFFEVVSSNVDSVYDSRDYETASIKVSYNKNDKRVIEIPEIWLKNRTVTGDSCRFSGVLIEE